MALFAVAAASVLLARGGAAAGADHARAARRGRAEGWVVLAAGDVFLGTFAFVPLSLLRIQDRPRLFSALSVVRHT